MRYPRAHTAALTVLIAFLAGPARAQAPTPGEVFEPQYRLAVPGYEYAFPRDHGAHPDFKLEWWYYTGHLDAEDGRSFGYELTFFRIGMDRRAVNPSAWAVDADGRPLAAVVPGGARQREMAYRFGINLVMYAFTGNYKADQVHIPAILERLGQ